MKRALLPRKMKKAAKRLCLHNYPIEPQMDSLAVDKENVEMVVYDTFGIKVMFGRETKWTRRAARWIKEDIIRHTAKTLEGIYSKLV